MGREDVVFDDDAFRRAAFQTVRAHRSAFALISARLCYGEEDAVQEILAGIYPFVVRLSSQSRADGSPRTTDDLVKASRSAMKNQLYKMLERATEKCRSPAQSVIGLDRDVSFSDYEEAMALAADALTRLAEAQAVLRELTEAAERLGIWDALKKTVLKDAKSR